MLQLQNSWARSSTEAEYIGLSTACDAITWIWNILRQLVIKGDTLLLHKENSYAFDWATDTSGKEFSKMRRIEGKHHKLRENFRKNMYYQLSP